MSHPSCPIRLRSRTLSLRMTWAWTAAPNVRVSALSAMLLALLIIAPVTLAHASPPDQTWLEGIYDQADFDDIVDLLTSSLEASGSATTPGAQPWLALEPKLCPAMVAWPATAPAYWAPLRAPPIA